MTTDTTVGPEQNSAPLSVAILILNWNGRQLLPECLPPLAKLTYPNYRVIVADNASADDSLAYIRDEHPSVGVIENRTNLGFSRGINAALEQIDADLVVLLNNDVVVQDPDWLQKLVQPFHVDATVGITGGKLLFPDEQTIQHAGAELTYPLAYSHHHCYREKDQGQCDGEREVDYVTGAAMAISQTVLEAVGAFDPAFHPFYYEEVDLCYRARAAGFKVLYRPQAVAIHHESSSIQQVQSLHAHTFHRNRLRFVLKHYSSAQFLKDFVPAEAEQLQDPARAHERNVLRQVYLEVLLDLPQTLEQQGLETHLSDYRAALLDLREQAQRQPPSQTAATIRPLVVEAEQRHRIEEPEFYSDKAVVGPLIAAVRESWNSVSTKWYVQAIIEQQQQFNGLVVRLLETQRQLLDERERETASHTHEIEALLQELLAFQQQVQAQTGALQQQLAAFEQRLARLEQLLDREAAE